MIIRTVATATTTATATTAITAATVGTAATTDLCSGRGDLTAETARAYGLLYRRAPETLQTLTRLYDAVLRLGNAQYALGDCREWQEALNQAETLLKELPAWSEVSL